MNNINLRSNNVLLLADIHFGCNKNSLVKLNDTCSYLKNDVIDICKTYDISDIIFLGDWFDNRDTINVNIMNHSNDVIRTLKKHDINLIMIVGNHDLYYRNRNDIHSLDCFREHSNVSVVDSPSVAVSVNGLSKYLMIPWAYDVTLLNDDNYNAVFGHFDIIGASLTNAVNKTGLNPTELLKFSSTIFSGHFHIRKEYNYSSGTIVTIGNPTQTTWGDCDNQKGVYILDTEDNNYKFIPNDSSRIFKKIYISNILNRTEKLDNITNNYIKLIIDKDIKFEHTIKIINIINSKSPQSCEPELVISQRVESTSTSDIAIDNIDDEILEANTQRQIEKYLEILRDEGWLKKENIDEEYLEKKIESYFKRLQL